MFKQSTSTGSTSDTAIIKAMIAEVEASKARLQKLQEGMESQGLSLDADRAYDGYYTAIEELESCL